MDNRQSKSHWVCFGVFWCLFFLVVVVLGLLLLLLFGVFWGESHKNLYIADKKKSVVSSFDKIMKQISE